MGGERGGYTIAELGHRRRRGEEAVVVLRTCLGLVRWFVCLFVCFVREFLDGRWRVSV